MSPDQLQASTRPLPPARTSVYSPYPSVPDWLMAQAKLGEAEARESEEKRIQQWVTLIRRYRGQSLSDKIGVFSPNGSNKWLGDDIDASNLRPLNIVKSAVRANTSSMIQARVSIGIEPATSEHKGAAAVAEGIYRFLENRDWTSHLETRIANLAQLSACAFLKSTFDQNQDGCSTNTANFGTIKMPQAGSFACANCGARGAYTPDFLEQSNQSIDGEQRALQQPLEAQPGAEDEQPPQQQSAAFACPECDSMAAEIVSEPSEFEIEAITGYTRQNLGDNTTEIVSPFEIRVSAKGTAGGQLEGADYFERHYLMTRAQIKEKYPRVKIDGAPKAVSFALQWQYALENNLQSIPATLSGQTNSFATADNASNGNRDEDLFEVRDIYLGRKRFAHYRSPANFEFENPDGSRVSMRAGNKFDEAEFSGDKTQKPLKNIKQVVINEQLCELTKADFCREYKPAHFLPDAWSFWSEAFTEILEPQGSINDLNTIIMLHLEKNSIASIVYDEQQFDGEDFDSDLIPTRKGAIDRERPIGDYFKVLEPPQLGGEPVNYMTFLLNIKNDLTGIQPAALGQAQPGTPYAAQLLQKQSSLGLLTPSQQSKAQAKVGWTWDQLFLAQKHWPSTRFEEIKAQYGEEWKQADIESFLECDLSKALQINYVEGSEIPTTLMEREVKLQAFLQTVAALATSAPGVVTPDLLQEVVSKLADYADVDVDFNNMEADERLASSRYQRLKAVLEQANEGAMPLPLGINQESGQIDYSAAVGQVIKAAAAMVVPEAENHATHKEFWADHLRALLAEDHPDELAIAVFLGMHEQHSQAEVYLAQKQMQMQLAAQAPAMQMQQQQQAAQIEQQQQLAAASSEQQSAENEQQQAAAVEQQAIQSLEAEAQREHDLEIQAREHDHENALAQATKE